MFHAIQKYLLALTVSLGVVSTAAQQTIVFFDGPAFQHQINSGDPVGLDLDKNGTNDVLFESVTGICTADVPTSACTLTYPIGVVEGNALLMAGSKIVILEAGVSIGSATPPGAAWITKDYTALATYTWSERYGTGGWGGPLSTNGSGYLGLQFVAADGIHYGWLFAELATNSIQTGPRILNWAYESRPNTPIVAGAIPAQANAQNTIRFYAGSPRHNEGSLYHTKSTDQVTYLDFDRDGTNDFTIPPIFYICQFPTVTVCGISYAIGTLDQSRILCNGWQAAILSAGTSIGETAAISPSWHSAEDVRVAGLGYNSQDGYTGFGGPLMENGGSGYIGVRFRAADGIHYGWIYATIPQTNIIAGAEPPPPQYLNWAYETRPNTPILAGAVPAAPVATPRVIRPNQLRLTWQSESGQAYQPQTKEQVDAPRMSLDFSVVASSTNSSIDVPITTATRFYRIVRVE